MLLVFALCLTLSASGWAQQSYRGYQQLSGRALKKAGQPDKKPSSRALPMRFLGWKHPGKFGPEYLKHFSRPRARAARTELLVNAARVGNNANGPSPQFPPSQLPGLLLRDSLPAGYIPTSVATGDFNGDGKLDFVVANGGDNNLWLYFGNGNGTFNLPIILPVTLGQSPVWVVTADLRGIGRTDLIVAEADSDSIGIFLANADGTFAESSIALGSIPVSLVVGDFNHDGKPDVVVSSYTLSPNEAGYLTVLPGLGNGQFGAPIVSNTIFASLYLSSADFNGDGFPDLLVSRLPYDHQLQAYMNNGDATFSPGQVLQEISGGDEAFFASIAFDADGDGIPDALATDSLGGLWFFHGNGDGTFNTSNPGIFPIGDVGYGIAAADVNGDGHLDVIVSGIFVGDLFGYGTEAGDQICVLEGDGKGNFAFPKVYRGDSSSYSLAVGDFNGDGHPDVVTANQDNDSVSLFLNDGTGGYGLPQGNYVGYSYGPVNAPLSGIVGADIDGDGSTDVAFIEYNQFPDQYYQLTVLLNDGKGNLSAPVRSDAINSSYADFGDFVLADFRNTGRPDFLAIAGNYTDTGPFVSFAPNSGGGHFGPLSVTNPTNAMGVLGVGDFNGDGKLDFAVVGSGVGNDPKNDLGMQIFLGNGDGTFKAGLVLTFGGTPASLAPPVAMYVGDFNRDGKLDLLVFSAAVGYNEGGVGEVYEFLGNGDGTFQPAKLLFSQIGDIVVADVNGDGHPDIVSMATPNRGITGPQTPMQFSIYLGQADGSFQLSNTYSPYSYYGVLPEAPYANNAGEHLAPMVADFNGDGNLDIAAFQSTGQNNFDMFVQFMLGNGDGTFTPTYDVFDFRQQLVTLYAADLLGTGIPEFLELNGYRSTYDVLPPVVAPSFQLGLVADPVVGSTGSGIILLDVPSISSSAVSLSTSDPAISVPNSVTIPSGQVSQTFSFNIGPAFNPNHVFAITAQMGTTSEIAYGSVASSGGVGFQASAGGGPSFPDINLGAGQTESDLGVGVISEGGYGATLSIQCLGLPSQIQCQFIPASLVLRAGDFANAVWVVSVGAGVAEGAYPAKIRVTDGVISQDIPFTVNVGDFAMSLSPASLPVQSTGQGSYTLTLSSIQQFDQTVNLSCGGLPAGATCDLTSFGTPGPGGTQMAFDVATQSVSAGNYQITVTGTSSPLTHTAVATLQVSDFSPSVTPTSATVSPEGAANFNVSVLSLNGFEGNVVFLCGTSTLQIGCSLNPTSTTVPAGGKGTSTLTVTASSQLGSAVEQDRWARAHLTLLAFGLVLPIAGLFLIVTDNRRKWIVCLFLFLALCWMPSCGGGSSGGGGTSYQVTVQVSSGNETKTAGTVTLNVN